MKIERKKNILFFFAQLTEWKRPYIGALPTNTNLAPIANARNTSRPLRMPPSKYISNPFLEVAGKLAIISDSASI